MSSRVWHLGQLGPRGCYRFSKLRLNILVRAPPGPSTGAQRRGSDAPALALGRAQTSPEPESPRRAPPRLPVVFTAKRRASPRPIPKSVTAGRQEGPAARSSRVPQRPPPRGQAGFVYLHFADADACYWAFHPPAESRQPSAGVQSVGLDCAQRRKIPGQSTSH